MVNSPGRFADTIEARFWAKVDKNGPVPPARPELGPCWLWTGATNGKAGYGIYRGGVGRDKHGSRPWVGAHRFAYELLHGPIATGFDLDHLCRVRLCVNPQHTEVVTHQVNTLRGVSPAAEQARRTSCINGHPFDKVSGPKRRCSVCDRAKELRRYIAKHGHKPKPNARTLRRLRAAKSADVVKP